jgi:DNA-directed RNA polymerase specialized sigma24 family protein
MEWLKIVADKHSEWVSMVTYMGAGASAEDIVQDAYLHLVKYANPDKFINNGKVKSGFMYIVLRNRYRYHLRLSQRINTVCLEDVKELMSSDETNRKEAQYRLDCKIDEITEGWHWYDRLLFEHYRTSGDSLRKINKDTNISLMSLFTTIKNCKQRLREELGEDYEDFKNEDYELL